MIKLSSHKEVAYRLFFSSLSNPYRLKIINCLRSGRKNVGETCQCTGLEQTLVSHNLRRLERCGMVFAEPKGKCRYYRVNQETIRPLQALIDAHIKKYCCKIIQREKGERK